ncbi:MAG: hypothetical protein IJD92_03905 [Bacilli bacterium]|nr:hypothetical protein [Bacilli bacterium]
MKKNKEILNHCPNFYKIKNYEFDENDYITLKIIGIYEDYIFNIDINNEEEVRKIEEIDCIISKYVDDYAFRREIQNNLLNLKVKRGSNIVEIIIENLIRIFNTYEDGYTRNIYFARWI